MTSSTSNKTDTTFYDTLERINPEAREFLNNYMRLPENEHRAHVLKVRDQAWKVCPYSCVGTFGFTSPSIQVQPYYESLLTRIKNGDSFLDLGCGLGQNVRKIVYHLGPSPNVFGSDLSQDLIDCGYDYFLDRASLEPQFFTGDLLSGNDPNLKKMEGTFDVIYATCLFHLWSWDVQLKASIATAKLLKPEAGAVVFGWQIGASPAKEITRNLGKTRAEHSTMFRHDAASLKKMWHLVGEETGTRWVVEAKNDVPEWVPVEYEGPLKGARTANIITFTITRI
ncbi:S-adenosyl-L-methionine-dependent methyltransferase-like [Venturia nashicola]|uniref:S-adenosyl-L-methionine-dependent methyltransferase-like n=1 Tax=Venturia nashicola TaxID=86259 RepID=A0A4Z1NZC5_9PEZI|nr:S-adenosyl-L-methionine-dependent methyltransferase-like [Venturia nashicola]TLD29669.1 S-adenosyl-L-methionine-dependent methyltransferase-like [Venturia nashicola]